MLSVKSRELKKAKAEAEPGRAKSKADTVERLEANPLWHQLATGVQAKLTVSAPDDPYEREADRIAAQVMRMPDRPLINQELPFSSARASTVQRECPKCEKKGEKLQRKQIERAPAAPLVFHETLSAPGQPLDAATRDFFELRLGADLGAVRVHDDVQAAATARAIHARAFAFGRNVMFGQGQYRPQSEDGRRLIAHELVHVAQQRHAQPSPGRVFRKIRPEDVSTELVGQKFSLREEFTDGGLKLGKGEVVMVKAWSNAASTAEVKHPAVPAPFNVPKHLLVPVTPAVAGVAPYGVELGRFERIAARGAAELEAFEKTEPTFKTEKGKRFFAKQLSERKAEQTRVEKQLNVRLIQAAMLNRFDASIKIWVDFYNAQFGFKGKDALDPNLIKSMVYRESQMGTFGDFMSDPPTHDILTRFNVLQAVDSWPEEQLLVIHEMAPALISKYHLNDIEKDLLKAETELDKLKKKEKKGPLNAADATRLAELKRQSQPSDNWQVWYIEYRAPGEPQGFAEAAAEFLNTVQGGKKHKEDYDFWIRVGVRAVFEKHKLVNNWPEAARAYNGSGPAARKYRDDVVQRAEKAVRLEKAGKEFVPEKL